jgi:hypothetical protein
MRKHFGLLTILAFGFISCSNYGQQKIAIVDKEINQTNNTSKVNFKTVKSQAILIGKPIKLLDSNLNIIADISNMTSKFVEITGVSDTIFNDTKDLCNAFWYVKIKIANKEGIVNGKQVFKIEDSDQVISKVINGKKVEFQTTLCMAMGVEYNGELMDCPIDQPVIINDEANNFKGLIRVIPNEYLKEAVWNKDFEFFQLLNDGGHHDKIVEITPHESGLKLSIHRIFQEGQNDFDVLLRYNKGEYQAEYLNYGEIKYE